MSLRRYAGKLLRNNSGGLANADNCCCEPPPDFCPGCVGEEIPELQIEFDATGVVTNPNHASIPCDCTDADCESFGGTYLTTLNGTGTDNFAVCSSGEDNDYCYWCTVTNPDAGFCDGGDGGVTKCYASWTVRIGQLGTDWYVVVALSIFNNPDPVGDPFSCGNFYQWFKNLGTDKPTCADVFPVTFTTADYGCPTGFVEEVSAPCLYSGAGTVTVSIPP